MTKLLSNGQDSDLTKLNDGKGVPLSANVDYTLYGVRHEKAKVFKSATRPLLLPFYYRHKDDPESKEMGTFTMMFKTGDDMRQDALVL